MKSAITLPIENRENLLDETINNKTIRVGYVLLRNTDQTLASTRITVLNPLEKLREDGYHPEILDQSDTYNPNRDLNGIVSKALRRGFGKGDIVYFQSILSHSAIAAARELKRYNIGTVFGVCNYVAPEMVDTCDCTVVPSQRLKDHHPKGLHKKIYVIHDGIEFPEVKKITYGSQQNNRLQAVFLTGKRYKYIRGMFLPDYVDLTVIGPYNCRDLETFRLPRGQGDKKGVEGTHGFRDFSKEVWSLDAYRRIADFDIGVVPIDLSEPMARPDMAPTETRSSNKLTQMMSAGLPVIAGPLPVYVDIITPGVDGFIAQSKDDWLSAFAELRNSKTRQSIGRAARERVREDYSLEAQVRKLLFVFDSLSRTHQSPLFDRYRLVERGILVP